MKTLMALCLAVLFMSGCSPSSGSGRQYLRDLGALIDRADRIEVVEHSFPMDLYDPATGQQRDAAEVVYRRVVLTPSQKDGFGSSMRSLSAKTQDAFAACIAETHHRIEFFAKGQKIDAMEICFECGQVEWKGSSATPPWALYGGLESFVSSIGLEPKRDWRALALKHAP